MPFYRLLPFLIKFAYSATCQVLVFEILTKKEFSHLQFYNVISFLGSPDPLGMIFFKQHFSEYCFNEL